MTQVPLRAADEASTLARHLTGSEALPAWRERHAKACEALLPGAASPEDAAIVAFALKHPWSLGPLDAALALARPKALLRSKILIASAILETTPEAGVAFLPRPVSGAALAWGFVKAGIVTAAWLALGLPLLAALMLAARLRA